jgi:hypothetical protein
MTSIRCKGPDVSIINRKIESKDKPTTMKTSMKAAIVLQLIALPAILAKVTVQVVSVPVWLPVTVDGKSESDGEEIRMKPSMYGKDGQVLRCLDENYAWTESCAGRDSYVKVAEFNFDEKTKDPRPFTVMPMTGRKLYVPSTVTSY